MALNNILSVNPYNLYSNSLTMNLSAAQPVAGNNTLWLNSANNHLYRDGVDLEGGSATFISFVPIFTPLETNPDPNTYTNIASRYLRVGNMVTVWSCYSIIVNSPNEKSLANITVPVASGSNLSNSLVYPATVITDDTGVDNADNVIQNYLANNTNSTLQLGTQLELHFGTVYRCNITYSYQI